MDEEMNNVPEVGAEEVEENNNVVILKDEDGEDVAFEFLDLIELDGESYVVLLPTDDDAEEVVILKQEQGVELENGDESYVTVEDEEVLNKVFDIFKDKFKDEFNFVDGEEE
jgi:uncharacterized protein YrzB (UPF0473 family)